MEDVVTIRFALFDVGHQIGVMLKVGRFRRAWRLSNPFRISLDDQAFLAGKARYRWPVSLWAARG